MKISCSFVLTKCLMGALMAVLPGMPSSVDAQIKLPTGQLVPDQLKWKPSGVPDRILLSWSGNPATSASVTWRTDTGVPHSVGQIAAAEHGPKFSDKATTVVGQPEEFKSDLGLSHRHSITFHNLQPDTVYVYRVGDGTNWSEWNQFRTAADSAKPFEFVYFGDAQNSLKAYWSRVVRQAYQEAPRAAFFLHAGDLINSANRDAEWGEWFYASSFIHRSTPCVATPGNHEYGKSGLLSSRTLSQQWRPTFAFPQNGPAGLEETCYWLDYQGLRLISLNSNERLEEQAEWLATVLNTNSQKWTIITYHHPLYSSKAGRDNKELREAWQPVFDRFKVDLVLQGHDHTYARTGLMTAETNLETGTASSDAATGTVYVVSVSGPKMYDLGKRPFMRRTAEDTQLYQVVSIDGDQLSYKAFTATGDLYDAFRLTKQDGQPNQLTEQIPDTPELRR